MEFKHIPVLLDEVIEGLNIKPDGIYIDGTVGGAGHSSEIAKRLTTGLLVGIDRDPDAVATATERLSAYNAKVVRGNYDEIKDICNRLEINGADGILMDLGVSSHQLDEAERGFSYHNDAPLDMRMSQEGISAKDIVNSFSQKELSDIIFRYGEEKFAGRIAANIVREREKAPIETTLQLADIIRMSVPAAKRRDKNPCKKTFQAIRIAVNDEFAHLEKALNDAFDMLKTGGRLCVITFHSLEDRIVKQHFAEFCKGCTCPPDFPVCICGNTPRGRLVLRKPAEASEEELERNVRARSAKLRIIEKLK